MKKIILKAIGVILNFTFLPFCSAMEGDAGMNMERIAQDKSARNLIRYSQQIRKETIWHYSKKSRKVATDQRIVFTLEDGIFNFQGHEEIGKKYKGSSYFDSIIEKGRPIRIINTDQINQKSVQELFCETWCDEARNAPYYKELQKEAVSILRQQGDWVLETTYSKQPKEKFFQEGCKLIIEGKEKEEEYQQALNKFTESAKQGNVMALYIIGMLHIDNKLHNPNYKISISDKKYYFEVGFSWIYLAAFYQYERALRFIYKEQKNFLPSLNALF